MNLDISSGFTIFSLVLIIASAALVVFSRIPKQTIANLTDLNNSYEKRIQDLEEKIKGYVRIQSDNSASISYLQGQLDLYKEVPLKEWANTMKTLSIVNQKTGAQLGTIAESNERILAVLKNSALIAATDRDAILNPNQTIQEQHVEHQTVSTTEAAS